MRFCLAILALLCAAPLTAGLLSGFDGKTEAEIAKDFENDLQKFLAERFAEPIKPRIRMREGRKDLFLQLVELKEESGVWQELAPVGWTSQERIEFSYDVFGPKHEYKTLSLPPDQIAAWFLPAYRLPEDFIGLAVWLASKGEIMLANAKLAELAAAAPKTLRDNIEVWLCEKHGWTRPDDGLKVVKTHDLELNKDGFLLLTAEAEAERLQELETKAKSVFEDIEDKQGDIRGRVGQRRGSPKMRLVVLKGYMERFQAVYGETKHMQNRRVNTKFERMMEAINEDLQYVETEKYKAERLGIDGDWEASAKAWDALLRVDPEEPNLVQMAAEAHSHNAKIGDAGRKVENPQAAKRAAELYDKLVGTFPLALSYMNYAGFNWFAAGDKVKARNYHAEVVKLTDGRDDLHENDRRNREYAEAQLRVIGK